MTFLPNVPIPDGRGYDGDNEAQFRRTVESSLDTLRAGIPDPFPVFFDRTPVGAAATTGDEVLLWDGTEFRRAPVDSLQIPEWELVATDTATSTPNASLTVSVNGDTALAWAIVVTGTLFTTATTTPTSLGLVDVRIADSSSWLDFYGTTATGLPTPTTTGLTLGLRWGTNVTINDLDTEYAVAGRATLIRSPAGAVGSGHGTVNSVILTSQGYWPAGDTFDAISVAAGGLTRWKEGSVLQVWRKAL